MNENNSERFFLISFALTTINNQLDYGQQIIITKQLLFPSQKFINSEIDKDFFLKNK